jgi:hydroxymethylbilane synthase
VQELLEQAGAPTELVPIRTTGDVIQEVPLSRIGTLAIFTAQLDEALLAGRIDLAVHSLKDLPTTTPAGIELAAVSRREDPRDALVGRGGGALRWNEIPRGAAVATSSLRRRAQLLRARPDLEVVEIRGNVDTRLAKLDTTPGWTATILAVAGLVRLGHAGRIGERLPFELMLPAPGQGALAVTVRAGEQTTTATVRAAIHDDATELAVTAERELLRRLEGGCQVPVGAYAAVSSEPDGARLELSARVVSLDGREAVQDHLTAPATDPAAAAALGAELAERLREAGADRILERVRA